MSVLIFLLCLVIVGVTATMKLGLVAAIGICAAILLLMPYHPRAS